MSYPRNVTHGSIWFLTRRCSDGLFLLRPEENINQDIIFCLAHAAKVTGIEVIAFMVMSNHYHAIVHDPLCKVTEFIERFHGLVAHVINKERGRRGILWSPESPCITRLIKNEDVLRKIRYTLANPVVAHLVDQVSDWPGASSYASMLSGKPIEATRPKVYFRKGGATPEAVTLDLMRPPGFEHFSAEEWTDFLRAQVFRIETRARQYRRKNKISLVGRNRVLATSPFAKPRRPLPYGKPRPDIACKKRAARIRALKQLKAFKAAHEAARQALKSHKLDTTFPYGTYRMRILGLDCAGPP